MGEEQGAFTRAKGLSWLFQLFFTPGTFFRTGCHNLNRLTLYSLVFLLGVVPVWVAYPYLFSCTYASDRLLEFCVCTAGAGLVGLGLYLMLGWVYRFRLRLCKAQETGEVPAHVLLCCITIVTIPYAIVLLRMRLAPVQGIVHYASIFLLLGPLLLSLYVGYKAVRVVFALSAARAFVFFVAWPVLAYVGLAVAMLNVVPIQPSSVSPTTFENSWMRFSYPQGWRQRDLPVTGSPGCLVEVADPLGRASLRVGLVETDGTPSQMLERLYGSYGRCDPQVLMPFHHLDPYVGEGIVFQYSTSGPPMFGRIFAAEVSTGVLLVADEATVFYYRADYRETFSRIIGSLEIKRKGPQFQGYGARGE